MFQAISTTAAALPRRPLARELGIALAVKAVLLLCLWALFVRGHSDPGAAEAAVQSWFGPVSTTAVPVSRHS